MQLEALFRAIGNTDNAIQPGSGIVPLTLDSSTATKRKTCPGVEATGIESVRKTIDTFESRKPESLLKVNVFIKFDTFVLFGYGGRAWIEINVSTLE